MFAVLKTGGKQYRVAANDILTVEKLPAEAGETVEFDEVLMLGGDEVTVGAPFVAGAVVTAEVLEQLRGREGDLVQEAPAQALVAAQARPPAVPDAGAHHRHFRRRQEGREGEGRDPGRRPRRRSKRWPSRPRSEESEAWHTRRQAARPATAATARAGGSASRSSAARR